MKLSLTTESTKTSFSLDHSLQFVLMGSCFSDELAPLFELNGYHVSANPFGTLFHPLAIAEVIENAIDQSENLEIHQRNDLFFNWEASSKLFGFSKEELTKKTINTRAKLRSDLSQESTLVVTFGTAWGYEHNGSKKNVGNCHKAPAELFTKKLTEVNEMLIVWKTLIDKLHRFNPELKIVITVSPVRHIKDGLVNNNRSKSRLIEFVHGLTNDYVSYFPSYEIVVDELRDYRFYTQDLVHPSLAAITYVFDRFVGIYMTDESQKLGLEVSQVKKQLAHQSLFPNSIDDNIMRANAIKSKNEIAIRHPKIVW